MTYEQRQKVVIRKFIRKFMTASLSATRLLAQGKPEKAVISLWKAGYFAHHELEQFRLANLG